MDRKMAIAIYKEYKSDFNSMTDDEIECESNIERQKLEEADSWLEAVAAWKLLGCPRDN